LKVQRALAGAVLLCVAASGTALAANDKSNPNQTSVSGDNIGHCTVAGQVQGEFTVSGVTSGWPPNHKPKDIHFTLTDTSGPPSGVTITVVGVSDEAANATGSGNTSPDLAGGTANGDPSATVNAWYLAERAGNGNGRVYTWTITGSVNGPDASGGTTPCDNPVTYKTYVVHDQGGGNDAGQDLPPAP